MSSPERKRRVPWFSMVTDVDVDVPPEELERQGWMYVGDDPSSFVPDETTLQRLIRELHEDEHDGAMRWCSHPLCKEVDGR